MKADTRASRPAGRWAGLLLLLPFTLSAGEARLAARDLETGHAAGLALALLPPEVAGQIVSHQLHDKPRILSGDAPAYGAVRFFLRPSPAAAGICRRDTYYVSLRNEAPGSYRPESPVTGPNAQLAVGDDCDHVPDAAFGWVQSVRHEEDAIDLLQDLMAIQRRARDAGTLPIRAACRSELPHEDPCEPGVLEVVRALPLDRIHLIEPDRDSTDTLPAWRLSIMPTGPGQPFFETRLVRRDDGWDMRLTWKAPPPF